MKDQTARIVTPLYGGAYSDCVMEFYYHMYGGNIGILEVDLMSGGNATRLFEIRGKRASVVNFIMFVLSNFKIILHKG